MAGGPRVSEAAWETGRLWKEIVREGKEWRRKERGGNLYFTLSATFVKRLKIELKV